MKEQPLTEAAKVKLEEAIEDWKKVVLTMAQYFAKCEGHPDRINFLNIQEAIEKLDYS